MANVQSIVTNAIYTSLQDRRFLPNINAGYLKFGISQLNFLLDGWRNLIPFSSHVTFNDVENLEATTFVQVETVNFTLNQQSWTLMPVTLTQFTEIKLTLNLTGIPIVYYFDELNQTIEVYPRPAQPAYRFMVWGRISQINLGEFDEIPANMPGFMEDAVTYELAYRMAAQFGVPFNDYKDDIRKGLIQSLKNKKSVNLTAPRDLVFGSPTNSTYAPYPYLFFMSGGT